ncbi:MAG: hypothetical protein D3909_16805, partial [Candidatus Electrothrix sp. ATG1]|nr:hypothetical protein [Candidatus Electrothrix sp. ATG1]
LQVARYSGHLKMDDDRVALNDSTLAALDSDTLKSLRMQAVNLTQNGDDILDLPQVTSEGGACGSWSFLPEEREPGPWLLYPAPDSPLSLRPLLWPVEGAVQTETRLTWAMGFADSMLRHKALAQTITELTADFCHPGWQEVEQLAACLGHLPLTSLDLWRSFAYSPPGMASLLLRFGSLPRSFVSRFEQELPFSWEIIPYAVWKQAMMTLHEQCAVTFGEQAGQTVFLSHLKDVVEKITDDHPALQYILGIARANFDSNEQQQVTGLQFGLGPQAENMLFAGDNSPLQKLLRNHASDSEHWPVGCNEHLRLARSNDALSKYLCPKKYGFHDPVINLPLMLAFQCGVAGQAEEWLREPARISLLRTCRIFDHDWFAEAYNLTIARCLADGLLS